MIEANMSKPEGVQVIGRLTQWDFGQSIKITGLDITSDTEVHFANERQGTAIKMLGEYIQEDKSLVVEIPDVSLQSPRDIYVFVYPATANEGKTIRTAKIKITARAKPEDYALPETKDYLMQLLNEVEELIAGDNSVTDAQVEAAVQKYMEANPVPAKTSDLTNDSDFQTGEQVTNTVNTAIGNITHFRFEKADIRPETGESNVIYLVPGAEEEENLYIEWLYVDGKWEKIGTTEIDLSNYVLKTELPTNLPNPHKLTFAGAVTAEYDGSGAVTVTIPTAEGSLTERIEKTDTDVELEPNKLYIFPEMETLSVALAEITDTSVANEYHFVFQSGATATTLSIPDTVNVPDSFTVEASKIYEISIMENCLCAQSWAVS